MFFKEQKEKCSSALPHKQVGEIFYWISARKSQLKPELKPYKAVQHLSNSREAREARTPLVSKATFCHYSGSVDGSQGCVFTADSTSHTCWRGLYHAIISGVRESVAVGTSHKHSSLHTSPPLHTPSAKAALEGERVMDV